MRQKLTPVFTSGKMKHMSGVVVEVGHRLADAMDKAVEEARVEYGDVEIKDLCARFTTDVIGSCAFGLECYSLQDPNAEFREKVAWSSRNPATLCWCRLLYSPMPSWPNSCV